MPYDPFVIKEEGNDIQDQQIGSSGFEVDGDIVIADSFQKKQHTHWKDSSRGKFTAILAITLFGILIGKLYYLQVVRGAEYYGAAEGNRIQSIPLAPTRGVILDKNKERLAYNVPDFALMVVPANLPDSQEEEDVIFSFIARTLGVEHFDLIELFSGVSRDSFVPMEVLRGISQENAVVLSRKSGEWGGVYIEPIHQRTYGHGKSLAHVLGYTGKISNIDFSLVEDNGYLLNEHVGKTGLEKFYQPELRGTLGEELVEVNSFGKATRILETKNSTVGSNLYLHIDNNLQRTAWDALSEMVEEKESPGGTVIVLDPRNGAVRAMVSYPSFDSQAFSRGISANAYQSLLQDSGLPLFNRPISGEYPSGSTLKLVVGAAALEEDIVSQYTSIVSDGGIQINQYWYPDWKYGGHGQTNITHALAESVNTYFYAIGGGWGDIEGLGVERIVSYGKRFGLGNTTGIDLPSERPGFLPSKEWKEEAKGDRWYLGDTYNLAIGQGDVLVTPMQVANFTAAIASGGILYAPRIVDRVGRDYESGSRFEPKILNAQVAEPRNIESIKFGLRQAVEYGTARSLSTLPVEAAGKTGTAQWAQDQRPHAWFTGFAPYQNPELVVTVLVEEGEGGDLAATPIAKKVLEWYFGDR